MSPRWPKSADGKWYWKSDTSSDELDGHYFLYAVYYDLVAETEAERQAVREVVSAMTGHLVDHDFNLIDHDGKLTRWARFGPKTLNDQIAWAYGRGLNSLSILSYLLTAEHITGEHRFREAFDRLVKDHGYLSNVMWPKSESGPGTGNQSDDEMAFMCYYNLLHYATDPEARLAANASLRGYWVLEEPEQSPLFNFIFAASYEPDRRFGRPLPESIVSDGLDFLKRYPLDRVDWGFHNSHRLDVGGHATVSAQLRSAAATCRMARCCRSTSGSSITGITTPGPSTAAAPARRSPTALRFCFLIIWGVTSASSSKRTRLRTLPWSASSALSETSSTWRQAASLSARHGGVDEKPDKPPRHCDSRIHLTLERHGHGFGWPHEVGGHGTRKSAFEETSHSVLAPKPT